MRRCRQVVLCLYNGTAVQCLRVCGACTFIFLVHSHFDSSALRLYGAIEVPLFSADSGASAHAQLSHDELMKQLD